MPLLVPVGVFFLLVMLAAGIAAFAPKSVFEPFRRLADFAARRPLAAIIAAAFLILGPVRDAVTKVTNGVRGVSAPAPAPLFSSASVTTNGTWDFSAPPGATVHERWRLRGAADDWFPLFPAGWSFALGDTSVTNLRVFSRGKSRFPDSTEISPLPATLGVVPEVWAANWYTWFTNNVNDARGKTGWAGHFAPLLERQGLSVYNFYSSGDEVFAENSSTPGLTTGVFHWPTLDLEWPFFHLNLELDAFPWQKQEVFKGVNAAGSLSAGWGFHCWTTNMNNETVWVRYSAAGANAMVSDGSIVTNAVFDRGVSAMFSSTISDYDKADILAFHIPAVSSPAGKVEVIGSHQDVANDFNLNDGAYRANDWGRPKPSGYPENELMPWLHSDIKNMAYYHVYPAFTNIVGKGEMR